MNKQTGKESMQILRMAIDQANAEIQALITATTRVHEESSQTIERSRQSIAELNYLIAKTYQTLEDSPYGRRCVRR
jgi:hypothetical protein